MGRAVIAIGGSAGALEPLRRIVAGLPGDLPVAILVTIHIPADARSALPHILARRSALRVSHAVDGDPLDRGRILVAPPDRHLVVEGDHVRLGRGPRENGHRPAIDPMFRTAARWWGPRAVGVVLSGALHDGTAGLRDLALRGGPTLVQDPEDAAYPSMPRSALAYVPAARALPVEAMAAALVRLVEGLCFVEDLSGVDMDRDVAPWDVVPGAAVRYGRGAGHVVRAAAPSSRSPSMSTHPIDETHHHGDGPVIGRQAAGAFRRVR